MTPGTQLMAAPTFSLKPKDLPEAIKLAEMMANSDLVPKDYKGKPGNVLIAVQMGAEVGLEPMQAIQNIAVINGKPGIYGDAGKALLLAVGCKIEEDDTETIAHSKRARCRITRPDGRVTERSFSQEDAQKAKLWGKDGPWTLYPWRQMAWRAFWFAARDGCADILKGMAGAEELRDYPEREVNAPPQRTVETVADKVAKAKGETIEGEVVPRKLDDVLLEIEQASEPEKMVALREEILSWPMGEPRTKATTRWNERKKVLREAANRPPTVDDAIAAVRNGDYDLAADLARGLSDKDKAFVESEIKAAREKQA